MRVLLDECLPRRLKRAIVGHGVMTVPEAGWAGKRNGELLTLAVGRFEVFVTIDRHLIAQRRRLSAHLAVVILAAPSNRFQDIQPLVPDLLKRLASIHPGEVVRLPSKG